MNHLAMSVLVLFFVLTLFGRGSGSLFLAFSTLMALHLLEADENVERSILRNHSVFFCLT